jgi:hypothetical protein
MSSHKPAPTAEQAGESDETFGTWRVVSRDSLGKRVICKCAICGHVCTIGADALESGVVVCGGCVHPPHSAATPDARVDSFAGAVAMLESRNAWKRHRGGGGG